MMKKLLVFYFHGYGSSTQTDKVERLKEHFQTVYAFPIDIDPSVSIPFLEKKIDDVLFEHIQDCQAHVVFVGTSLGAWYASELARRYGCHAVCINPAWQPSKTLTKYGVPQLVLDQYGDMVFSNKNKYFIGTEDEVIDFTEINGLLTAMDTTFVEAGHRFNGPEFNLVIDHIKAHYS